MNYFDRPVQKARTIETLEIFDILEIVVRDFERYNIPDGDKRFSDSSRFPAEKSRRRADFKI